MSSREIQTASDLSAESVAPKAVSPWQRRARITGYLILGVISAYGLREFIVGDWDAVADWWRAKLFLLPVILVLAIADIALEGVGWAWVYQRFGLRAADRKGVFVYLAGRAGLLLPAQLGRLIRPDAMARLGRGTMGECLKAEGTVFVLDSVSVLALLVGLAAWLVHPLLAPLAALAVIAPVLYLGNQVAERLSGTRLGMPQGFWWNWRSLAIITVEMSGWVAHGLAFYVLVLDLPGTVDLWRALFLAPASAVLGVGTGLPGGIGATEGLLGASLRFNQVPVELLALAVGAFRVVTFWIWIPIGWLALAATRRSHRRHAAERRRAQAVGTAAVEPVQSGVLPAHVDGS